MSQLFAPWVEGSSAPKLYQTPPPRRLPHLQVVPSAPECGDTDYEIEDVGFGYQRDYEGFLAIVIKGLLVLILFCCVALVGLGIGSSLKGDASTVVTVQPGDSLYSIATSLPHAPPPNVVVADIRSLNTLENDTLYAGQKLLLPEY